MLTRLLAPRPRRDRDYSRHNPRRDRDETLVIRGETETRPRRDRDVYINGRDETETRRLFYCLNASSITWDMRNACAVMPHNIPPSPSCHFLRNANVSLNELHAQVTL